MGRKSAGEVGLAILAMGMMIEVSTVKGSEFALWID